MNRIESIAVLHLAKFECCVDSAAVLSASLAPRPPASGRARTQGPERELRLVKLEHIIPSCGTPRLSPKAFATAKSSPRLRPLTAGRQANSGAGQECFRFPNTSAPNRPPFCISDSSFISWHLQAFFHVLHQHLRLITTPFLFYLTFFLYYHPHICRDERRTLCDDITYFRLVECPWLFDDHISPTAFYANPPFLLLSKSCQDRTMAPTSPTGTPDPPTCSLLCRPKHV